MRNRFFSARKINTPRFIAVYLFIMIPVLLIGVFSGQAAIDQLHTQEHHRLQQQLDYISTQLNEQYVSYTQNATVLSTLPELRPQMMVDGDASARHGIQLLSSSFLDTNVSDVFVYYGRGKIYARNGVTNVHTFFSPLTADSYTAVNHLLYSDTAQIIPLIHKDGQTVLMVHQPVNMGRSAPNSSINFYIRPSMISDQLRHLCVADETYIAFQFKNGDYLCYTGGLNQPVSSVTQGDLPTSENPRYFSVTTFAENMAMEITVWYRTDLVYRNINQWQNTNTLLYVIGSLFSLVIAFILGRQRERQFVSIESALRGLPVEDRHRHGIMGHILPQIESTVQAKDELERGILLYRHLLRQQLTQLLFRGILKEPEAIRRLFDRGGWTQMESYYFIGCLTVSNEHVLDRFLPNLRADLYYEGKLNGNRAVLFLAELPATDYTGEQRKKMAAHLGQILQELGAQHVCIGMSRIHSEIHNAHQAYLESTWVAERMTVDTSPLQVDYWENIIQQERITAQLSLSESQAFSEALQAQSPETAIRLFDRMEYAIKTEQSSRENRRYLRYCILQVLLALLPDDEPEWNVFAVQIDPADETEYAPSMRALIERFCLMRRKVPPFEKALIYIQQNYSRYDLSLEEVAEYVGLSKNYLSNLFRTQVGIRYIDYLTNLRMDKVSELLIHTDFPINKIFPMVGYVDKTNYSKKFKTCYGISAQEYRRRAAAGEPLPQRIPSSTRFAKEEDPIEKE